MRYRVLPYRQGSKSAKALADKLGGKVLKLADSRFKPRPDDICINWGNTTTNDQAIWGSGWKALLNDGDDIRYVSNKLLFFQMMKEAGCEDIIPEFWTNVNDIPDTAFPVVCRTVLAGHSGDGIVIANNRDDFVPASLYVRYVKKQDEYRVHVGFKTSYEPTGPCEGTVIIAVQRKARRLETPDSEVNWQVRNHANGFIFQRSNVNPPEAVLSAARTALVSSGLDFGAVDVIWNKEQQRAYVLEINTAPGLEGQTVDDYANFFKAA